MTTPRTEREKLVEALKEAIGHAIASNGEEYAYDRCRICGLTWYGPRGGRVDPEPERHNHGCPVPGWRALAAAADLLEGEREIGWIYVEESTGTHRLAYSIDRLTPRERRSAEPIRGKVPAMHPEAVRATLSNTGSRE